MKRMRKILIIFSLAVNSAILSSFAQSGSPQWEVAKSISDNVKQVSAQSDIHVYTAPSRIILNVSQPVNVKIFTILGKQVSSQKLEPGIYEYRLNPHGIYIIKTNETTCKVAI